MRYRVTLWIKFVTRVSLIASKLLFINILSLDIIRNVRFIRLTINQKSNLDRGSLPWQFINYRY